MDFGTYLKQLQQIESHLYLHRERLKVLEEDKNQRLRKLKSLEGLVYQVAYLREIKNMNLQEIADLMGYSYQYIKEVSSKTYF